MINREGQIWIYNNFYVKAYFIVFRSDISLKEHHVNIFYDAAGCAPRSAIVVEPGVPMEEWVDVCRIA